MTPSKELSGNGLARRLDCLELVSEAILVDFEVDLREHSLVDVNTHCLVIGVMKGKEVVLSPTAHIRQRGEMREVEFIVCCDHLFGTDWLPY